MRRRREDYGLHTGEGGGSKSSGCGYIKQGMHAPTYDGNSRSRSGPWLARRIHHHQHQHHHQQQQQERLGEGQSTQTNDEIEIASLLWLFPDIITARRLIPILAALDTIALID